jgi:hypothetical protein
MSTYKQIYGYTVPVLTADPSPATLYEGSMWFNTTANALKVASTSPTPASWSIGGTVATARTTGGAGIQTAGLLIGGGPAGTISEEYDGSSFASGGNLATAVNFCAGFGLQTAAVGCGGYTTSPYTRTSAVQNYDGSTWTSSGSMPEAKYSFGTAGLQTTGLIFGGRGSSLNIATAFYI